jgi:hypothetical protein
MRRFVIPIGCAAALLAAGCQPGPTPQAAPAPTPPPVAAATADADGPRWEKTGEPGSVTLRWTDGASQSLRLICRQASKDILFSAAAAAPSPPPPNAKGALQVSGKSFPGALAQAATEGETLAITLPASPDVLQALRGATNLRFSFGQVGVSSGIDTTARLLSFADDCTALTQNAPTPASGRKTP